MKKFGWLCVSFVSIFAFMCVCEQVQGLQISPVHVHDTSCILFKCSCINMNANIYLFSLKLNISNTNLFIIYALHSNIYIFVI